MTRLSRWFSAAALATVLAAPASAQDLTGQWRGEFGGRYVFRQAGEEFCWSAAPTNVFCGTVTGDLIVGSWLDLPTGRLKGSGRMVLKIVSPNRLIKIYQTANYMGSVWVREGTPVQGPVAQSPAPAPAPAASPAPGPSPAPAPAPAPAPPAAPPRDPPASSRPGAPPPSRGSGSAHWKLDETGGETVADASGSGHGGTLKNGPRWSPGRDGGALSFDGVDDFVDLQTFQLASPAFTIALWFRGDPTMQAYGRILDQGYGSAFALGADADKRKVMFEYLGGGVATRSPVIDQQWHHLAVVKSGTRVTLFVDGREEASTDVRPEAAPARPLLMGFNPGEGSAGHWRGDLDDVRIYDRALSASDVLAIATMEIHTYDRAPGTASGSLVASWSFDEGSGTQASDGSGQGHRGTLMNGARWISGVRGSALRFDGVDDYVDAGTGVTVETGNFTVEAWVRGDPTMEPFGRIVDKGYATGFALGAAGDGRLSLFELAGSAQLFSRDPIADQAWHHVAVVRSGTELILYRDGVEQGRVTRPPVTASGTMPLLIGFNPGEGTRGHWKGDIDEVRIYRRALTAQELRASAQSRAP